ncbi:MAG: hypothetical protein LBI31_07525 [Zoogloeaceae bacterium]|jgi:hypothetical protein|nr:hypothetical protein [Zoogloeaceae bacterium]
MSDTSANKLFSFQGYVYLGDRGSSGKLINPVWVGDATLNIETSTESIEHKESFSGQRLPYGRMDTSKSATATLTLFEATRDNLALALYAKSAKLVAGSVTGEAFPADLSPGKIVVLDHGFVTDLVIKDSSGTQKTLAEGVNYRLKHPDAGHVEILDVTTFTQPFSAAYQYEACEEFGIFSTTPPERWLQLVGKNTLNDEPVIVDLFRVKFDPASQLPLHNEEFGSFELKGSALVDSMLATQSELGGFGRITFRGA